ncbi:MAG: hypothetical protein OEW05_00245 [Candidatus Aminicenantes bacterium]|nr:hypothetical protein [Candidatus Aminicenantes bacterium]
MKLGNKIIILLVALLITVVGFGVIADYSGRAVLQTVKTQGYEITVIS